MGRKRNRKNKILENIEITAIAAEGKGFGKLDGKAIFVEDGVPGDIVDVFVTRNKKDYAKGKTHKRHQASKDRQPAFCKHFGVCGGCKWQDIAYETQLAYKQSIVEQAFSRVGKLDYPEIMPIIGGEITEEYRNKMEYTFSDKRWLTVEEIETGEEIEDNGGLGFHVRGVHSKVVDIYHCYLQKTLTNDIRNAVRDFALENGLTFYNIYSNIGFLRNLILRNTTLGQWMLILCCGEDKREEVHALLDHLISKFPQLSSVNYVINLKKNDTIFDQEVINYHGDDHIVEVFEGIHFKISPKSFFQTNPYQGLKLYQITREFADLKGEEFVFDLYTGTGSIALFVAKACKKVVGIEEVDAAIIDAKFNAEFNKIDNAHFFVGDVRKTLNDDLVAMHGKPDVVITDPPRAGMHADVVDELLKLAPAKIVYVSCNPVTQARDLQLLSAKYKILKVQPVDMFPHTHHIENVALLALK